MAVTAVWMVGNAATILPQNKVFTTNPDLYGYLFIGVLVTLPLALRGLQSLPRLAPLLVGVLIVLQLGLGSQAASADNFLARTFASAQSAGLPPGSVLMTSGNDTAFTWAYLQRVERRRSDLVLLHRVLLGHENERVRLGGEEGLGALGIPWQPEFRSTPSAFLAHLKRPFFIEMREPELEALSMGRLRSHGLVAARRLGDEPWLTAIRSGVFWEFSEPSFSADAEAALVATYYGQLWGAVQ